MYTWISHEWNPVKGKCYHDCQYCYMKRWGAQKPIRLDEKEFSYDMGSGRFIFVVSGSDLFARDVPLNWILEVLNHAKRYDMNSYLYQSKNTRRMAGLALMMKEDDVVCTTIETNRVYPQMGNTLDPKARAEYFGRIPRKRYVTIEPIMDFDLEELVELIKICNPEQVNIGADSGNNHLPEPSKEKILALIDELKKFTVIDQKRNLGRIL